MKKLLFAFSRCILLYLYAVMALTLAKRSQDMRDYQQKIEYESKHDEMTGLYNKKAYAKNIKERKTQNIIIGIIYFDVNGLKQVNDNYGHDKGD